MVSNIKSSQWFVALLHKAFRWAYVSQVLVPADPSRTGIVLGGWPGKASLFERLELALGDGLSPTSFSLVCLFQEFSWLWGWKWHKMTTSRCVESICFAFNCKNGWPARLPCLQKLHRSGIRQGAAGVGRTLWVSGFSIWMFGSLAWKEIVPHFFSVAGYIDTWKDFRGMSGGLPKSEIEDGIGGKEVTGVEARLLYDAS